MYEEFAEMVEEIECRKIDTSFEFLMVSSGGQLRNDFRQPKKPQQLYFVKRQYTPRLRGNR